MWNSDKLTRLAGSVSANKTIVDTRSKAKLGINQDLNGVGFHFTLSFVLPGRSILALASINADVQCLDIKLIRVSTRRGN